MAKLVVMGVAGSGKTVLAQRLAARLGGTMVEGDDFHLPSSVEKMRSGTPLDDADREPWLVKLGSLMAAHALMESLSPPSLVVDGEPLREPLFRGLDAEELAASPLTIASDCDGAIRKVFAALHRPGTWR